MNNEFRIKIIDSSYLNVDFWIEDSTYFYECNLRSIPYCCAVHVLCNFKLGCFNNNTSLEFLENCFEWSLKRTRLLYLLHNEEQGEAIINWAYSKGFALEHKVKSNTPAASGDVHVLWIKGLKQ